MNKRNRTIVAIVCGDPGTPTNGQRTLSSTTYNSVVTYTCDVGYTLQRANSRTCQADGQWSGGDALVHETYMTSLQNGFNNIGIFTNICCDKLCSMISTKTGRSNIWIIYRLQLMLCTWSETQTHKDWIVDQYGALVSNSNGNTLPSRVT